MKNLHVTIFTFCMILLASTMSLYAQNEPQDSPKTSDSSAVSVLEKRHDLSFGIGFFSSTPNFINASMYSWINPSCSLSDVVNKSMSSIIPSINIAYHYRINKTIAVGGLLSSDLECFHSVMFKMQFYYISKPKFSFYGDLGLGATLFTDNNTDMKFQVFPNFGVYPLGVKFGDKAGGMIELGYGYKGIVNFGAFLKL